MHAASLALTHMVTPEQFVATWMGLGVAVSLPTTLAVFGKYGHDKHQRMPVLVGCRGDWSGFLVRV